MNTPVLVIGNKNYSSWSLRPWFFLRKNEVEFSEKQLWLDEPDYKPAVSVFGSGGKVPVLVDAGTCVWDSLAIIEYVIESFACPSGWPKQKHWRAHARSMVCEMHSSFPALRAECPMDIRNQHGKHLSHATCIDIHRISEIWTQALEMSGRQGRWLYGDFSVADAMYAPVVFRFASYDVDLSPLLQTYLNFVLADKVLAEWIRDARREGHSMIEA